MPSTFILQGMAPMGEVMAAPGLESELQSTPSRLPADLKLDDGVNAGGKFLNR